MLSKKENCIDIRTKISNIENSESPLDVLPKYLPDIFVNEYYFISYSHKDYKVVYKDLLYLQEAGLQFWYDRGMPAGKNWKEMAVKNMYPFQCKGVIFYLTKHSLESESALNELGYAIKIGKQIIVIYAEDNNSDHIQTKLIELISQKDSENSRNLQKILSNNKVYLLINSPVERRVEQIKANLNECPKLFFDDHSLIKVADTSLIKITNEDVIFSYNYREHPANNNNQFFTCTISPCAFANCTLVESIDLSFFNTCLIREYSFRGCRSLESLILKDDEALIGICRGAFSDCTSLKIIDYEIRLIKSAGSDYIFSNCRSLEKVNIQIRDSIGNFAFSHCISLKKINLKGSDYPISIGNYAFYNCKSLTSIVLPKEVQTIGKCAFELCESLRSISLPENISLIERNAFKGCNSLLLTIDNGGGYVGNNKNKHLVLMNSYGPTVLINDCTKIIYSLDRNSTITELYIPDNIINITAGSFDYCRLLEKITVDENNMNFLSLDGVLYSKDGTTLIHCPQQKKGVLTIGPTTKQIGTSLFLNVALSEFMVDPKNKKFESFDGVLYSKGMEKLINIPPLKTQIIIPKTTKIINDFVNNIYPFAKDLGFDDIKVEKGNKYFECKNSMLLDKREKRIIRATKKINGIAFIQSAIEIIDKFAFLGCDLLLGIIFETDSKLTTIYDGAFKNCNSLKDIVLPNGLRYLYGGFDNCTSLNKIVLPATLEYISEYCFTNCPNLRHVYFAGTKKNWIKLVSGKKIADNSILATGIKCKDGFENF